MRNENPLVEFAVWLAWFLTHAYTASPSARFVTQVRKDDPYLVTQSGCGTYTPPKVMETRNLDSVDVNVYASGAWQPLREYKLTTVTTDFSITSGTGAPCPPQGRSGNNTLTSVTLKDRNYGNSNAVSLYTMGFTYVGAPSSCCGYSFSWPHLNTATNGFGGTVTFAYAAQPGSGWSHSAVVSETRNAWNGATNVEPDIVRTFSYAALAEQDFIWPYISNTYSIYNAENRGYASVTETDSSGSRTVHSYYTTGPFGQPTSLDDARTGREYDTIVYDRANTMWHHEQTTWSVRQVDIPFGYVNFVYPSSTVTTLKDGTALTVNNSYDNGQTCGSGQPQTCFGLLTSTDDVGTGLIGSRVITNTSYNTNTTAWVFTPQYVEKIDPENANALLSSTSFYYDGANSRTPATAPARGLLTATSTKLNTAPQYSASFNAYDIYGNKLQSSAPTFTTPESQPPGGVYGSIPITVPVTPATSTSFDATYHVYPQQETNLLGQSTTYSNYDYVLGRPQLVTEPTGRATNIAFDTFGRVTKVWDDLDTSDNPTRRFTYNWGPTAPSSTLIEDRTVSGAGGATHLARSCVDGLGRPVEQRQSYAGTTMNVVRTDYDARGLTAVRTNAANYGVDAGCSVMPAAVTSFDRTSYTYDPLGNVVDKMAIASGQSTGPYSESRYDGLTSTFVDPLLNQTRRTRNVAARTLTAYEPSALPTSANFNPTLDGFYLQWHPVMPSHVSNINDNSDATYVDTDLGFGKDTALYPISLPPNSVVMTIKFHFRWMNDDTAQPVGSPMRVLFRQSGIDTNGPLYSRTLAAGWGEDVWTLPKNPATDQPWTTSDVASPLEFGFLANGVVQHPYVSKAWVEVTYAPAPSVPTVYHFDKLGRLDNVTDSIGAQTQITYDLGGRKTQLIDPDMGTWDYTYDAAGRLLTQADGRSPRITTTLGYDAAERLTTKSYSTPATDPPVTYHYDTYDTGGSAPACAGSASTAVGMMTHMTDSQGNAYSCFDVRGRETLSRRTINGDAMNYDIAKTFWGSGAPKDVTYPDLEVIHYAIGADGAVNGLSSTTNNQTLLSNVTRTPWGAPSTLSLGSGLATQYTYDYRKRVYTIQTGAVQNLQYTYDDASNVKNITDSVASESADYTYDQLHRLTGMTINGFSAANYAYDTAGDLTAKVESYGSMANPTNISQFTYADPNHKHAVSATAGTPARYMTYDGNGNQIGNGNDAYDFDAENRLKAIHGAKAATPPKTGSDCMDMDYDGVISVLDLNRMALSYGKSRGQAGFDFRADIDGDGAVSILDLTREAAYSGFACPGQQTHYYYDGNGALLKRTNGLPASLTSTIYIGGVYEKQQDGTVTKYYQAAGRSVAMRTVVPGAGAGTLNYLLADQLTSTTSVTDSAGVLVASVKYWPFGNVRTTGATSTDKLYTGQQQEPGTSSSALGLYNYGARFYSATLGKFLSVDPVVGRAGDPQSWNSYTYVRNNPMRFVDPTGLDLVCLIVCSGSPNQIVVEDGRCHACEALVALANAGYHSAAEVTAHQQLVDALVAIANFRAWVTAAVAADNAAGQSWTSTVAQGAGPGFTLQPGESARVSLPPPAVLSAAADAIVQAAINAKLGTYEQPNDYPLDEATRKDAQDAAEEFLRVRGEPGEEIIASRTRSGKGWKYTSADGTRQVRVEWTSRNGGETKWNFERRNVRIGEDEWQANGHLRVPDH